MNHLWEFLGQMPFAQGPQVDMEKWKVYFKGFNLKDKSNWKEACTIPTNSSTDFNQDSDTIRALIKYSISLFKIRFISSC